MIEVLKKGAGFKTECRHCGSILKFDLDDMEAISRGSDKFPPGPWSHVNYIVCPVCGSELFVKLDNRWADNIKSIHEGDTDGQQYI